MRKHLLLAGVVCLTMTGWGCAITDYEGHAAHQTASEAKLWGSEISFTGTGDPELDGTYAYTVKYDNRTGRDVNMRIITYRNPIPGSFSRDGQIDRDGDDIQGRSGILGGRFALRYVVTDPAAGCQFFANDIKSHGPAPQIALCEVALEEVDKDMELQASFSSFGDLLAQIWSGALTGGFTAELTGVRLNGADVPLASALSIGAKSSPLRPSQIAVDLGGPGGAALVQAILANTADGVPTSVGLTFDGGMTIDLPSQWKVAFDHDALWSLL